MFLDSLQTRTLKLFKLCLEEERAEESPGLPSVTLVAVYQAGPLVPICASPQARLDLLRTPLPIRPCYSGRGGGWGITNQIIRHFRVVDGTFFIYLYL
jgi:hypothetical protein